MPAMFLYMAMRLLRAMLKADGRLSYQILQLAQNGNGA